MAKIKVVCKQSNQKHDPDQQILGHKQIIYISFWSPKQPKSSLK